MNKGMGVGGVGGGGHSLQIVLSNGAHHGLGPKIFVQFRLVKTAKLRFSDHDLFSMHKIGIGSLLP